MAAGYTVIATSCFPLPHPQLCGLVTGHRSPVPVTGHRLPPASFQPYMFRKLPLIILLLHAYVGWRLLPDMLHARVAFGATALWLIASLIATPLWPIARQVRRQPLKDRLMWASMLAMGSFSSLFVLTLLRDASLFAAWLFLDAASLKPFQAYSALGVPLLAALATLAGFVNARRRAAIRRVDVPIAGLPGALPASASRRSPTCTSARRSGATTSDASWSGERSRRRHDRDHRRPRRWQRARSRPRHAAARTTHGPVRRLLRHR